MREKLSFVVIDTMTSTPFSGNATPVFILGHLDKWLPERSMQLIARELNHSETAFVRRSQSRNSYKIRWFTPTAEEPFCGHGVLAAAQALHSVYGHSEFKFRTHTGIETSATILLSSTDIMDANNNEKVTQVLMRFPSSPILPSIKISEEVRAGFAKALRVKEGKITNIGENPLKDIIIELSPTLDFSAPQMDIDAESLLKASPPNTRSQVITSSWAFDKSVDFAKRVFAYGGEDQATGSTYCALVPYWGEKLGKDEMRALQPSFRGGEARVRWDREKGAVEVVAECVKTAEGWIVVPDEEGMVRAKL